MRLANVIAALSDLGPVELFALVHPTELGSCRLPPDVPVQRVMTAARSAVPLTRRRRLLWLASGRLPLELFGRRYGAVQSAFKLWEEGPYDLVWFGDAEAFVALSPLVQAPTIVDFDDLEDQSAWLKDAGDATPTPSNPVVRAGRRIGDLERRLRRRKNARLWRALRMRVVREGGTVTVCSPLDRSRAGVPHAVVIPNGYAPPPRPLGRITVGAPPTILFPGYLRYGPNIDAARRLVEEIGPRLRAAVPEATIRLVGLADARAERLHRPPAVVVTGRVEDMATELRRADLLAVPLRVGGGTRIKILEAFAHRLPVVSTSRGAEGLDVEDGQHLLIRDAPDDFAAACVSLLRDQALRLSLVDKASALFEERYRWDRIRDGIAELASTVAHARAS